MRCLRTVFNWCRDEGLTTNYPFKGRNGYKIREEETTPNNLTAQEFADLRDYPCEPWQQIYIDLFCLSVYLGGVNVGDLLLCKGLTNGKFVFVRRKTDKINSSIIRKKIVPDKVGKMRKIERTPLFPKLTTYSARYTFASIAANDLDISENINK